MAAIGTPYANASSSNVSSGRTVYSTDGGGDKTAGGVGVSVHAKRVAVATTGGGRVWSGVAVGSGEVVIADGANVGV